MAQSNSPPGQSIGLALDTRSAAGHFYSRILRSLVACLVMSCGGEAGIHAWLVPRTTVDVLLHRALCPASGVTVEREGLGIRVSVVVVTNTAAHTTTSVVGRCAMGR